MTTLQDEEHWSNYETKEVYDWIMRRDNRQEMLKKIACGSVNMGAFADSMEQFLGMLWEGNGNVSRLGAVDWVQLAEFLVDFIFSPDHQLQHLLQTD